MTSLTIVPFQTFAPSRGRELLSSLLFSWSAEDASLDALSGQVGTFARPLGGGAMISAPASDISAGRIVTSVHSQPRWESVLNPVTGAQRMGLLLDPARTNLVRSSENFAVWWGQTNAPTVVPAAIQLGQLRLDLLGDVSGSTLGQFAQNPVFTGNGAKYVSVFVSQGTAVSSVFRIWDATATANRLLAVLTWTGGGVASVAMTTGVLIGIRQVGWDGPRVIYELRFQTTSVTATNVHQWDAFPATTSALVGTQVGTLYVGGAAAFDSLGALSYLKSDASPAVANDEFLSWPIQFPRRQCWMYLAFTELGGRYRNTGASGLVALGDINGPGSGLVFYIFTTGYALNHNVAGAGVGVSVTGFPVMGTYVELLATMDTAGKPTIEVALNGVSQPPQTAGGSPSDLTTDWTSQQIQLGTMTRSSPNVVGGECYHALKVGEGITTMAKARGYR